MSRVVFHGLDERVYGGESLFGAQEVNKVHAHFMSVDCLVEIKEMGFKERFLSVEDGLGPEACDAIMGPSCKGVIAEGNANGIDAFFDVDARFGLDVGGRKSELAAARLTVGHGAGEGITVSEPSRGLPDVSVAQECANGA